MSKASRLPDEIDSYKFRFIKKEWNISHFESLL
jgi:hypothetical protein